MKMERKFTGFLVSLDYRFKNIDPWIDTAEAIIKANSYIKKDIEDKAKIKRINLVKIFKGSPSKGTKTELYYEVIIERPSDMKDLNYLCGIKYNKTPSTDLKNNFVMGPDLRNNFVMGPNYGPNNNFVKGGPYTTTEYRSPYTDPGFKYHFMDTKSNFDDISHE